MNCEQFQYLIYKYLDDDLSDYNRTEADTHLQICSHCRNALLAKKRLSEKLYENFKKEKAKFSFREMIENVLRQNDLMIR